MPRPTPIPVREKIFAQWRDGVPSGEIAQLHGLPKRTVDHLISRFRERGEDGIATTYCRQGRSMPEDRREVCQAALALREEHPAWGSELIRLMLLDRFGEENVPTARSLRRWFSQHQLSPAPPGSKPRTAAPSRAIRPHQTWQLDAAEDIELGNGERVSWVRIVDEHTGGVLKTRVFSRGTVQPRCRE